MESTELMEKPQIRAIIEALLLAAEDPLTIDRLATVLPDVAPEILRDTLASLELEFAGPGRGIHLVRIAGGYQLRTNPEFGGHIRTLFESKPVRLSRAAMETLAIVAYRQPLTRAEADEVRGVNCSGVLKTLQEYELIDVIGQLDDIGKPNLYGTTDRFLEFFGLEGIGDLPTLESSELEALIEMHDVAEEVSEEAPEEDSVEDSDDEPTTE